MIICSNYTIVSGVGKDKDELVAFDKALRSAGIHKFNLVPVSSVLPNLAEYQDPNSLKDIDRGAIVHVVLSKINIKKEPTVISAGICLAISKKTKEGIIGEYSGEVSKEICRSMLQERIYKIAETHDIWNDLDMKFEIVTATTSSSVYTCCVAAVVMW
jgi:arginine decarboxylase